MILKGKKKLTASVALLAVIGGAAVTAAFSVARSNELKNMFEPAGLTTEIVEEFVPADMKKAVQIANTGESPAFVRARVTVSPEGTIDFLDGGITEGDTKWSLNQADGFYYYMSVLPPANGSGENGLTSLLMNQLKLKQAGYTGGIDVTVYHEAVVATLGAEEMAGMSSDAAMDAMVRAFREAGDAVTASP